MCVKEASPNHEGVTVEEEEHHPVWWKMTIWRNPICHYVKGRRLFCSKNGGSSSSKMPVNKNSVIH